MFRRLALTAAVVVLITPLVVVLGSQGPDLRRGRPDRSHKPHPTPTVIAVTPTPTARPTPTPTPRPTPAPTPTPTPTSAPTPTPGDPWAAPFGSRPASGPISLSGAACQGITLSNKTFSNLGANVIAIRLENCSNVVVEQMDFINVAEGVYAINSTNITLRDSRYLNILGPHLRDGHNRANLIQLNNVTTALVDHNKGKCGDTEDIVSFTGATSFAVAEDNQFEGGDGSPGCLAWSSASGSGIATSDGSGHDNTSRRNTVLNPGQVGIFISGGTNNKIDDNIIVGQQRPLSNRPSYIAGSAGCNDEASGNRAYWIDKSGALLGLYDPGDGCTIIQSNNNWTDTTLDPNAYHVQL